MRKTIAIAVLTLAAGCSSSSTNPDGSGGGGAGGQTGNNDGAGTFTLKMNNYLSWCLVTEQGTDEGITDPVTLSFPAGMVVNLHAMAESTSFMWGYWFGTDGDTTAAHDTNMTTTVTMTKDKIIQACCPITGDTTPCIDPT
jgi:hypothetical protein